MINQLYIIGNGFDIAHSYQMRLFNFIKWTKENNHFDFLEVADHFDDDTLWSDYEFSLETLDNGVNLLIENYDKHSEKQTERQHSC